MLTGVTERTTFPWWYSLVKLGLPLVVGLGSSLLVGFALTGVIGVPSTFGMLQWAPALYGSTEGLTAFALLVGSMGTIASVLGVATSFFVNSLLFHLNETIVINSRFRINELERKLKDTDERNGDRIEEMERALRHTEKERVAITEKFNLLRGSAKNNQSDKRTGNRLRVADTEEESNESTLGKNIPVRRGVRRVVN